MDSTTTFIDLLVTPADELTSDETNLLKGLAFGFGLSGQWLTDIQQAVAVAIACRNQSGEAAAAASEGAIAFCSRFVNGDALRARISSL